MLWNSFEIRRLGSYLWFLWCGQCKRNPVIKTEWQILDGYIKIISHTQGSQNFKIPGSPSGRYSSDFGSPKINLTSPNKKKTILNQKHFQYTNINEYQGKSFLFYYLQSICRICKNQFKAIYDFLRAAQVKWTPYEWGWTISMVTY